MDTVKFLNIISKFPFHVLLLLVGFVLFVFPSVTIDQNYVFHTHTPKTYVPVVVGGIFMVIAIVVYLIIHFTTNSNTTDSAYTKKETQYSGGDIRAKFGNCEIYVIFGRIEKQSHESNVAVALPCNEYFDEKCVDDPRSALGAYVAKVFEGQKSEFVSLMNEECKRQLGQGLKIQKTESEYAVSLGPGKCAFLSNPLGKTGSISLISTSTQRPGEGIAGGMSYVFSGLREMVTRLADRKINEVVMPILGAGHGGIDPKFALLGLLLAVAETARYGTGGQRLKKVTIVVFQKDENSPPEVSAEAVCQAVQFVEDKG